MRARLRRFSFFSDCLGCYAWITIEDAEQINIIGDWGFAGRDEVQRIKLDIDVRQRVRSWLLFDFSPTVSVEINLVYERVRGFCRACRRFVHEASGCDQFLVKEKAVLLNSNPEFANLSINDNATVEHARNGGEDVPVGSSFVVAAGIL